MLRLSTNPFCNRGVDTGHQVESTHIHQSLTNCSGRYINAGHFLSDDVEHTIGEAAIGTVKEIDAFGHET
jgi:hypothetical protein